MSGVEFRDVFSGTLTVTSVSGTASLGFMTYRGDVGLIEIRKIGYKSVQLLLQRGDTTSITQLLEPVAELPAVLITGKYRLDRDDGSREGFDQRCSVKHVSCFREDYLTERATYTLVDILKGTDGINVVCNGRGTDASPTCIVKGCEWFIDGFKNRTLTYAEVKKMLGPTELHGIEVYRSDGPIPLKYSTQAKCAVVLWTK
jgi:hypothetical protein